MKTPEQIMREMRDRGAAPVEMKRKVLEKNVEAAVCRYARARGLTVRKYSTPNHRSSPDRIFFGHGRICFLIEFKRPGVNKPTAGQQKELDLYNAMGFNAYLCNDVDLGKAIVDREIRL